MSVEKVREEMNGMAQRLKEVFDNDDTAALAKLLASAHQNIHAFVTEHCTFGGHLTQLYQFLHHRTRRREIGRISLSGRQAKNGGSAKIAPRSDNIIFLQRS